MPVVKDWYSKTKLKYPQIKKAVLPLKARQLFSYSITSCLTTGTDNACVITNTYSPEHGKSNEALSSLPFPSLPFPYKQSVAFGNTPSTYILPAALSTCTVTLLCSSILINASLKSPLKAINSYKKSVGTAVITVPGALDCHYSNNIQQPTLRTIHLNMHIQQSMSVCCLSSLNSMKLSRFQVQDNIKRFYP